MVAGGYIMERNLKEESLENAKFMLSHDNGACIQCTPFSLNDNEYDYCFYCKMVLMPEKKCNKHYKDEMARAYINNELTIKLQLEPQPLFTFSGNIDLDGSSGELIVDKPTLKINNITHKEKWTKEQYKQYIENKKPGFWNNNTDLDTIPCTDDCEHGSCHGWRIGEKGETK